MCVTPPFRKGLLPVVPVVARRRLGKIKLRTASIPDQLVDRTHAVQRRAASPANGCEPATADPGSDRRVGDVEVLGRLTGCHLGVEVLGRHPGHSVGRQHVAPALSRLLAGFQDVLDAVQGGLRLASQFGWPQMVPLDPLPDGGWFDPGDPRRLVAGDELGPGRPGRDVFGVGREHEVSTEPHEVRLGDQREGFIGEVGAGAGQGAVVGGEVVQEGSAGDAQFLGLGVDPHGYKRDSATSGFSGELAGLGRFWALSVVG